MLLLVILFAASSILLIALAIPMIQEKVKPNWFYGFRTPKTVNNPHIWYPANKRAGWWLVGMGITMLLLSLILPLIPGISLDAFSIIVGVIAVFYGVVM